MKGKTKSQQPVAFEPTTSWSQGLRTTTWFLVQLFSQAEQLGPFLAQSESFSKHPTRNVLKYLIVVFEPKSSRSWVIHKTTAMSLDAKWNWLFTEILTSFVFSWCKNAKRGCHFLHSLLNGVCNWQLTSPFFCTDRFERKKNRFYFRFYLIASDFKGRLFKRMRFFPPNVEKH